MTKANQQCQPPERMLDFLRGGLTSCEEESLQLHLDVCLACRQLLSSSAADEAAWDEAHQFFSSEAQDNALCIGEAQPLEAHGTNGEQFEEPESIESLLKLLGPTDDPRMLGRIGSYEIVGVLGRGGMGVVFKAYEPSLNRYVAIKLLLPHLAASGAARMRFAREGRAAAAVIDDNVLPIFSVSEWQGIPYLVTQLSRGSNLQKRINDSGPLELREILRLGMQTASGLAAAHTQGLVHRDVKPSNILLDGTVDRALLTDFGLARAVDDASITCSGIIAGTPQYMSPEQARGGAVDARSDLFGLGSVLYTMCTGRPPFRAENSFAVLRLITDVHPRPIREVNPDIPEWLCVIIEKLMAKSPDERYQLAAEVSVLLSACLAHVQQPTVVGLSSELREEIERHRFSNRSSKDWRRTLAHYITYRMPYWLPCFLTTLIAFAVSLGPAMTLPTLPKESFLHSIPPALAISFVTAIGFAWGLAITVFAKRVVNEADAAEQPKKRYPFPLFVIGGVIVALAIFIPWFMRQSRLTQELVDTKKQLLAATAVRGTDTIVQQHDSPNISLSSADIGTSSYEVLPVGAWSDAMQKLAGAVSMDFEADKVSIDELIRWGKAVNGLQAGLLIPTSVTYGKQIEARLVLRKIAGDEPLQLTLNGRHVQLVTRAVDRVEPAILDSLLVPLRPQVVIGLRKDEQIEFPSRRLQFGGSQLPDIRESMFVGCLPGIVSVKFKMLQPDGPPIETEEVEVRVNEELPLTPKAADGESNAASLNHDSLGIPFVEIADLHPGLDKQVVEMEFVIKEEYIISGGVQVGYDASFRIEPQLKSGDPKLSVLVSGDCADALSRSGLGPDLNQAYGVGIQATGQLVVVPPPNDRPNEQPTFQFRISDWKKCRVSRHGHPMEFGPTIGPEIGPADSVVRPPVSCVLLELNKPGTVEVEVSVGFEDGIRPGDKLNAIHEGQIVGKVEIIRAEASRSSARIVEVVPGKALDQGDKVESRKRTQGPPSYSSIIDLGIQPTAPLYEVPVGTSNVKENDGKQRPEPIPDTGNEPPLMLRPVNVNGERLIELTRGNIKQTTLRFTMQSDAGRIEVTPGIDGQMRIVRGKVEMFAGELTLRAGSKPLQISASAN